MLNSTLNNANILIVDDKQANIDVLLDLLDRNGYLSVKSTTDPRTVVSLFTEFKPDLILLDLMMPHLDGFQVMEQLKPLIPIGEYFPILVLTANITPVIKRQALVSGATDFLTKPFDVTEVSLRIKNLLETRYLHVQLQGQNQLLEEKVRERTTELIKAREKAEESDNLKSAFLNNLSHEIRTPMNQILGFASFLKDPQLTESLRDEYIGIINSQSHQLLHIITDIVEISKITAGQVVLKPTSFNLSEMMDELLASFKPKAEHRNLQLTLSKKMADAEAMIQGDQVKLKQILSNLIDNAIKFTDAGSIHIEYYKAGMLIITVKDSGIGIEEQEKQVIFDHFRQIEITMARKYGGLGLGLTISNAYIRMMSGMIRVESEPGKGSTFFVEIPYVPAVRAPESAEQVLQTPVISRPDWHTKTILIAEDEESNVQFLSVALRATGINLLFAINGMEAVEQCKIHPEIAVVLMDIKMPRMDGLEATKIIKSFRIDLPVIATTAFAMRGEKEYILESGCDDYLPKPIKREDLIAKIQKYIDTR